MVEHGLQSNKEVNDEVHLSYENHLSGCDKDEHMADF